MRTVLAVALAALLAAGALAQGAPPKPGQGSGRPEGQFRRMSPEERLKRFSEQLKLTPAQQKQVKAIWEKRSEKMRGMRQQMEKMKPEERMKAFDKFRNETNASIRKILNPTQQKQYDKMLKEEAERRKQFQRGPGGPGGQNRGSTGGGKSGGGKAGG